MNSFAHSNFYPNRTRQFNEIFITIADYFYNFITFIWVETF